MRSDDLHFLFCDAFILIIKGVADRRWILTAGLTSINLARLSEQ